MMKILISIALLVVTAQAASHNVNPQLKTNLGNAFGTKGVDEDLKNQRIINGLIASSTWFPYTVFITFETHISCGGSLISEEWVLTAASCAGNSTTAIVYVGAFNIEADTEEGRIVVPTSRIVRHHGYVDGKNENNIALIKLSVPVTYSDYIKPVELATGTDTYAGKIGLLSGWGRITDDTYDFTRLRYGTFEVITNEVCSAHFGTEVAESILCSVAENRWACYGDEGNPLVVDGVQVGVMAFLGPVGSCALSYYIGYTRASSFSEWIQNVTASNAQ